MEGDVSHCQVTRFLVSRERIPADLWHLVKPHVRRMQNEAGVLIIDASLVEKPFSDENDIVCWHSDHSKQAQVKAINFMTSRYHCGGVSLPVGFTVIAKAEVYFDKERKAQRCSPLGKNESYRALLHQAVTNQIPFPMS